MPHIQAFRGLRYDLGHVGSLSDVIAPPYDVIDPALQEDLYKKHPANVIRLELNRDEPGDDANHNRYSRAARFLKNWKQEGVLQLDPDPALYVYHQSFQYAGRAFLRRGFMCRVRLERFGEGRIYPHEETHSGPKQDRLLLTRACKTNLSQIFGIYPDPENEAQELLETAIAGSTPLQATDHLGVVHRLWVVRDVRTISAVSALLDPRSLYIADGHHRYETACNYRDELASAAPIPDSHPANYVLTMCVSMNDPGMIVLPTHRLFRGVAPIDAQELTSRLGTMFTPQPAGRGPRASSELWSMIENSNEQGAIGFYTARDDQWTLARISPEGERRLRELATDHSADWCGLGVSILHRLAMDELLGLRDLPKPMYVHSVSELIAALEQGDTVGRDATGQIGQGGAFQLAALVMPATVEHVRKISEHHERMPAKSTYFYPKLLSGLVFNPLE
ncbi:MAG: DUF1015 domain-containing protein [Planctomycetes bacterium]|nr:DUF1015 domain-containing protein [Planctomycetota bacterium]